MSATSFPDLSEEHIALAQRAVVSVLEGKRFNALKALEWNEAISEQVVDGLHQMSPNFKVGATCLLVEKIGAGLHTNTTAFWDSRRDGCYTVQWENDSINCVLMLFGAAT